MSVKAVERFIARVFADESLRQQFLSHPEETLRGSRLSQEEREALLHCQFSFAPGGSVASLAARVDSLGFWVP